AVVGGGPAGLSVALRAAESGAEVVLIDDMPRLGGSLCYARFDAAGGRGESMADRLAAAAASSAAIRTLTEATCTGLFADNWLAVIQGHRLYKLRAKAVVVATGSHEQPAVFRNNDLPGIMLGSAAQRLIRCYGVRPGRRAVVMTANADGHAVALDLAEAGVEVAAVADLRPELPASPLTAALDERGIRVLPGHAVVEALAAPGKRHVTGAVVAPVTGPGQWGDPALRFDCDLVCMAVGYSPAGQLLHHAGARFAYDEATHMFAPAALPAGVFAAGSVGGAYDLDAVIAEGRHAGWAAARAAGFDAGAEPALPAERGGRGVTHPWPIFPHPRGKEFVDFDEDLVIKDIVEAAAEGFDDVELLKRFSTVGMGPSQGRQSTMAAVRILARETGRDLTGMQVTTQRPPSRPETFGQLAGRVFEPERHTAMHHRHLQLGARMMPAGLWLRPAYYGRPEERERAIREEVLAVRRNVGLIDVSTLGGLDIRGPDAAEFLNRMYTFSYTKLPVGRSRYVLMTDQAGAIIDDGVACRFHEEHFYVTATTGGADTVYRQMLFWNAQWRLDVDVANVTAAYAGVNIAGPRAREVLQRLCDDVDLSASAFPYLAVRTGTVAGIPARLMRVGFVGELGYEVHVPASQGEMLWDALMAAGAPAGIRPFGVEAQRVLRLEKGHIIINQDTDGLTHPYEADMGWAIARNKPFFIGGRSIEIQAGRPLKRRLVGFTLDDPAAPVPEECHLVVRDAAIVGRVTSAVRSPTLDKVIGLAYVAPDQAEPGKTFTIKIGGGRLIEARVSATPFYDPENKRQEM
ncbi:MAG: FAD-dependent oxidoreductase, partial [Rhodospirillaceae bacterium]|nr:FAD-dependent oxidoreductase [Rhodospirillaceae bacterium]